MISSLIGIIASSSAVPVPTLPVTANLTGYWDASNASSVTLSSGKVSQLNDLSGNGRHMVQATGANQPTYTTAAKNGLNAMQFSGSQWMEPASTWTQTACTFFIVVKFDSTVTGMIATGYTDYKLMLQNVSRLGAADWNWQLEPGGAGSFVHFKDGACNTNWNYFGLVRPDSGNSPTATVNNGGTWTYDPSGGNLGAIGTGKLTIGRRQDAGSPMTGYIGEVIQYSGTMGSTDRNLVNSYLATKWGI